MELPRQSDLVHLRKYNQVDIQNIEGLSFENLPNCSVCLSPIIRHAISSPKYFYQHIGGEEHPLHEECLIYVLKNRFIKVLSCPVCHKPYIEDETTQQLLEKVENNQVDRQQQNRSLIDKITIMKNILAENPLHKIIYSISVVASFAIVALVRFDKIRSSSDEPLKTWVNILYPPILSSLAQIISQLWIVYMCHQHSPKVRYIVQTITAVAILAIEFSLTASL